MADHADEPTALAEPPPSELDLRNTIEEALWSLDSIRVTKPALHVRVTDGQAYLSGIVASPMMRDQIEEVLFGLPLTLDLVDDAGIQYAAAYALATDARTRDIPPGYQVTSFNGQVTVRGKFTPEQAAAVQAVAGSVRGVREVSV